MIERIVRALRGWKRLTQAVEGLLVDNISATAPWLTPAVPAYLTYNAMMTRLAMPAWIAIISALIVETLGLASVNTTLTFWDWNQTKRMTDQRAPWIVAMTTATFYMGVVLTFNVLMDQGDWQEKVAKALLSSLSICSGIILALRAGHARRIDQIERTKEERKMQQRAQVAPQVAHNMRHDWRILPEEDRKQIAAMTVEQLMQTYGLAERTAQLWRQRAREDGRSDEQ